MDVNKLLSLKGKVAIVTGGNRMYGKFAAEGLCEAGAKVYIACRTRETSEAAAREMVAAGGQAEFIELHQDDPASIRSLVETVVAKEGHIDILITAARTIAQGGEGWFQTEDGLSNAVKINSAAWLYLTQLVGEQMIAQKSGSIISFGSMMGLIGVEKHNYDGQAGMGGGAYSHDYAQNKSGITAWTRTAASYYGRYGVRVNAVCPGGLKSDRTPPIFERNYSDHTQVGRLAVDDDVKGIMVLLASDAGAYLTGLSIPLDGGYTCM